MRTIKFRARRKNGEWVVGNFIHHFATYFKTEERYSIFLPKPENDNGGYWVEDIEPDTIGQFTGLYACDKEIYEGDILKWKADNRLYAVIFNWGMFYASVEVCNQEIYGGFPLHALAGDEKGIEIVGNIYDNPELKKRNKRNRKYKQQ